MTTENDIDNVIDFTAYKMRDIIDQLASQGEVDMAYALQEALDEYLLGNIDIRWQYGWPYLAGDIDT